MTLLFKILHPFLWASIKSKILSIQDLPHLTLPDFLVLSSFTSLPERRLTPATLGTLRHLRLPPTWTSPSLRTLLCSNEASLLQNPSSITQVGSPSSLSFSQVISKTVLLLLLNFACVTFLTSFVNFLRTWCISFLYIFIFSTILNIVGIQQMLSKWMNFINVFSISSHINICFQVGSDVNTVPFCPF